MVHINNREVVYGTIEQMSALKTLFEQYRPIASKESLIVMDTLESYFDSFGKTTAEVETNLTLASSCKLQDFVNRIFQARIDLLEIMQLEAEARAMKLNNTIAN